MTVLLKSFGRNISSSCTQPLVFSVWFIVSNWFTVYTLTPHTRQLEISRDKAGWSSAASVLKRFAVRSFGSMLQKRGHPSQTSLAALLSLCRFDIHLFFFCFSSLVISVTPNKFTKPLLLWENAADVCCLLAKWRLEGMSTNTDTWLTKTMSLHIVLGIRNLWGCH